MEKKLYSIFWNANATDFNDPILERFYEVLPRIVKIATF